MGPLVFALSILVIFFAIIYLGISLFKKSGLKKPGLILSAGVLLFFISLFLPGPETEQNEASLNTAITTNETEETAKEDTKTEQPAGNQSAPVENEEPTKQQEPAAEEPATKQKEEAEKKQLEEARAKEEQEKKAAEKQQQKETAARKAEEKAATEKEKQTSTNATVKRVVDGDTLKVNMDGRTEDVRLLLVDTPETVHPNEPVQPYGPEASQFVKDTLTGKKVRVEVGEEERDKYGRLLAYVFIDGETIQEKLLRNGLARTAYLYNDLSMLDQFHQAQQSAKSAGIGVWSIPGYAHADHDHGYHYQEESAPSKEPESTPAPKAEQETSTEGLQYDPSGPDRNCGDFSSQAAAQAFMEAAGSGDPHRLDGNDNDGQACESLP